MQLKPRQRSKFALHAISGKLRSVQKTSQVSSWWVRSEKMSHCTSFWCQQGRERVSSQRKTVFDECFAPFFASARPSCLPRQLFFRPFHTGWEIPTVALFRPYYTGKGVYSCHFERSKRQELMHCISTCVAFQLGAKTRLRDRKSWTFYFFRSSAHRNGHNNSSANTNANCHAMPTQLSHSITTPLTIHLYRAAAVHRHRPRSVPAASIVTLVWLSDYVGFLSISVAWPPF